MTMTRKKGVKKRNKQLKQMETIEGISLYHRESFQYFLVFFFAIPVTPVLIVQKSVEPLQ